MADSEIPETVLPDPVVVFNSTDRPPMAYRRRVLDWMECQGININLAYRVEVFVLDTAFARVYQPALNEDGTVRFAGNEFVPARPFNVVLTDLPPGAGDHA